VLYACQDFEHDRGAGLNSVPQAFGLEGAFWVARLMHVLMIAAAFWLDRLFQLGPVGYAGTGVVALLLVYEHSIISPVDLRRMNAAFFLLNGLVSVVFFLFVALAVFVG
jgi:4-hydroxybenzoate polyprenyltransferase